MLSLIGIAKAQTTNQNPIILPLNGASSLVIESGQSYSAISAVSIILKPGVHFKSGSNILLRIDNNMTGPAAPNNPDENLDMNWTLSRSFDASGAVIREMKSFFDTNGKLLQSQSKNIQAGHVLAAQPLYDVGGREIGSTMSAPINNASFAYKADFIKGPGNTVFTYRNYSRYKSTDSITDKRFRPDPVDTVTAGIGSLGFYYSSKNVWERLQDYTNMPYSTFAGPKDGTDIYKR
ncbi:hypothetical protein ACR78Z_05225 [Sphingobacterium thalpophilum]|uniref:hypothetical protein n=1 Tax=Sphingobacterium thalpophilum TaxID=259 RepID=UPI003DA33D4C